MRNLFADGLNSFWHFFFGVISVKFLFIVPLFAIYQLLDPFEKNVVVDFIEFGIGLLAGYAGSEYFA